MMTRRSTGKTRMARALWYAGPRARPSCALRRCRRRGPARRACARCSAASAAAPSVSSFDGGGAAGASGSACARRCRRATFPFPVKYGYCAAGVVEDGPGGRWSAARCSACIRTRTVFVAPADALAPVPDGVPARRATLAANMETALNAALGRGAGPGDRIVVVGAGVVGLLVGCAGGAAAGRRGDGWSTWTPAARPLAEALGAALRRGRTHAPGDADVVFHASATAAGLDTAIDCAGLRGHHRRDELVRRQPVAASSSAAPSTAAG